MIWLSLFLAVVLFSFGGVILFGAPYLPTLKRQVNVALELAELKPGQTLLELGCGDGKVMVAAARQGLKVVGYELNPFLAVIAWLRTRRFGKQARVVCGNFWTADWPPAEAIFVFLLPKYMDKLDAKIVAEAHKPVRLVSFAFRIESRRPHTGKQGVYLYKYD